MSTSLPGRTIGHPTSKKVTYFNQVVSLYCLSRYKELSNKPPSCKRMQQISEAKGARSWDGSSGQKARKSSIYFGQGDLLQIRASNIGNPTSIQVISRDELHEVTPSPDRGVKASTPRSNLAHRKHGQVYINTSPPERVEPAPPTGTQGEKGYKKHGIGAPPPLVGLPGASGGLGSTPQKSDHHHTTSASSVSFTSAAFTHA